MFLFDPTYLCFMAPAFLLMVITSIYVKSAYNKWSKVPARSRMTGYEAAQRLIARAGLYGHQDPAPFPGCFRQRFRRLAGRGGA